MERAGRMSPDKYRVIKLLLLPMANHYHFVFQSEKQKDLILDLFLGTMRAVTVDPYLVYTAEVLLPLR